MKKIYIFLFLVFLSFKSHTQNLDAFILTVEVGDNPDLEISGLSFWLPVVEHPGTNYTVDFGDGTVLPNQSSNVTHTYSEAGIYTITITGIIKQIYFYNSIDVGGGVNARKLKSIEQWGAMPWVNMSSAFIDCSNLVVNAVDAPDLSQVTSIGGMFIGATNFNSNINHWDVSTITSMGGLFSGASSFNQPLNNWDVSNVTNMDSMFSGASSFNQPLNNWDVSGVTSMGEMFYEATSFNQPLDNWDVSNVTTMTYMFYSATSFNQSLNNWNISNVTQIQHIFAGASSFNKPLDNWDVSNIHSLGYMFKNAVSFNQPLNNWDVSGVTYMMQMFSGATSFNQPLDNWNVSNVLAMSNMFMNATSFNQDLSSWEFVSTVSFQGFLAYSGMNTMNYDLFLLRCAELEVFLEGFIAYGLQYCNSYVHDYLANELIWSFTGDSLSEDCEYNSIYGNVLFDENNNGCDTNDFRLDTFFINADNGTPYYSTLPNNGQYQLNLFEDTYNVSLQNIPDYFTITPESYTISYTGFGNYEEVNFCISAIEEIHDLKITLIPVSEARPGFVAEYQIVIQNLGTQTVNDALIIITFDNAKQIYLDASPNPIATTSNQLSFEIEPLSPFSSSVINIFMETFTPPTVNGDDILNFTATVTPNANDYTPEDNTFTLEQIVVNSYDPNDKQVLQGDKIHIDNVGEYLHYLIRFQNTGTASAIHVRIEDELHETLDWSTIQIVSASHNYRVEISEGNQIEFIFQNINLPHEDADEAGSNGFIAYKIKPVEGLEIGDFIIGNEAGIYFDFNEPIITNSTSTEIVLPLPEIEPYGAITLDENNNGCDAEDIKTDFFLVQIENETSNYRFSPEQGVYTLDFLDEDVYTISLQNLPEYFTVTPESYTLDYQGLGDYEALDFCITANQEVEDVHVVILPLNQTQSGSTSLYRIVVQNLGTQTIENLSFTLEFDPAQQTFITSTPSASSTTSDQLSFTVTSLPILQSTVFDFSMQTFSAPIVNVGDVLAFNVSVNSENDITPNDNAFELKQTVVESSQANYKRVLQGDKILIEQASEYLHYFISFENINTTTVTNVKIEEELHETLDWTSLQLLNASHPYKVNVTQGNQIEFTFDNINLTEGETGFVTYRIKPIEGLQVGDMIIGNEAEIYFDAVLSSITNAADTEIVNPTVGIIPNVKDMLWVYPNPTSDMLYIQTKGNIQLEEVQLYNLQGRVLISSKQNLQSINVGDLSSGIYLLNIKTNEGNFSQRVIKK